MNEQYRFVLTWGIGYDGFTFAGWRSGCANPLPIPNHCQGFLSNLRFDESIVGFMIYLSGFGLNVNVHSIYEPDSGYRFGDLVNPA